MKDMNNTRTENIARNATFGLISQIINIILSVIGRTMFISVLGAEYLGLNGLFSNILILLSFAELGLGNAVVYRLYKPLAYKDEARIRSLMSLYSKAYNLIGLIVFIGGLLVVPFIGALIKEVPYIKENIYLIYILFLVNSSSSYYLMHKRMILEADQRSYVVIYLQQVFRIVQTIAQISLLYITGSYIGYLVIGILSTILLNLAISFRANRLYPYLLEKKVDVSTKKEGISVLKDVKSLFLYRFGYVILNGTDNIIITILIGITAVGINSNYVLIISVVSALFGQILNGFTASVGNINALESIENKERAFEKVFFLSSWMYGFCAVGFMLFLNNLITLWIGENYVFPSIVVFSIVLQFYVEKVHFTAFTYRTTNGLFSNGQWAPFIGALMNIILSFWLGYRMGLSGIFFATSISRFLTTGLVDPYLVYKHVFMKNSWGYHRTYFSIAGVFVLQYFILSFILSYFNMQGVMGFIFEILIVTLLFNMMITLLFWKNPIFIEIRRTIIKMIIQTVSRFRRASGRV